MHSAIAGVPNKEFYRDKMRYAKHTNAALANGLDVALTDILQARRQSRSPPVYLSNSLLKSH